MENASPANARKPNAPAIWRTRRNPSFSPQRHPASHERNAKSSRTVLLYRDREPALEIADTGQPWSFDGDGKLFRLVSEAHRINLAHLFDPLLAIHTSMVDPLPHQITAVYGEMLPRQ